MAYPRPEAAGGRKAPRHEVAGCWALAGSERYIDFDARAELVCGREIDTPYAPTMRLVDCWTASGREAATRIAERFHNFRVSA